MSSGRQAMASTLPSDGVPGGLPQARAADPTSADAQAAALHRLLFAESPDAILISDGAGRILDANPAALRLLGYGQDDLTAFQLADIAVPALAGWRADTGLAALPSRDGEVALRRRDGVVVPAEARTHLLPLAVPVPGDEAGLAVTVLRDLSERKAHEETLARLAATIQSSGDAIVCETLDGIVTDWNPAAERLYGYPAEDIVGQPLLKLISPERLPEAHELLTRARAGETVEGVETVRYTRDGRRLDVSLTVSPVRNEAGQIIATSAIVHDMTERKAVEAELAASHRQLTRELRASEARYRTLVEQLPAVVYLFAADEEQTRLYFSPYLEELTGFTPEEALAQPRDLHWLDFVHPDDRERVATADRLQNETGCPFSADYRTACKDGSYVWVRDECVPVRDDAGQIIAWQGVLLDISDQVAALEAAQAGIRSKSQFLAMMSHELRTPLQAILGYADFLLNGPPGSLTVEQREDVGYIRQGAGRMVALIEQMLDLSRMEAGRLEMAREPVDPRDVLEQVRQDIAPQARDKALEFASHVPKRLPWILGDAGRVRQILLNLAGNAVKFTEQGAIWIEATATREDVQIAVRDTGIGISAEALPGIFEEFRQVDGNLTRRHGGAGLGLAISRRLAEQMGGHISVESAPGAGSTFTLHLPKALGRQRPVAR